MASFVFRDDNFRNSQMSGVIKTEKFAVIRGCNLCVPVYSYKLIVGIDKSCQLWVAKRKPQQNQPLYSTVITLTMLL